MPRELGRLADFRRRPIDRASLRFRASQKIFAPMLSRRTQTFNDEQNFLSRIIFSEFRSYGDQPRSFFVLRKVAQIFKKRAAFDLVFTKSFYGSKIKVQKEVRACGRRLDILTKFVIIAGTVDYGYKEISFWLGCSKNSKARVNVDLNKVKAGF